MLRGIGRLRARQGSFSPASIFAGGAKGAWYDPSDITSLFQDGAGTTPVAASGDPLGRMLDKSGRSNRVSQATAAARPTYTVGGGFSYFASDGVDDGLTSAAFAAGTFTADMDMFVAVRRTSAASGILFYDGVSEFIGCYVNGSGAATGTTAGYTIAVDGTPITDTRDALFDLLGTWAVVEVRNVNMSAWAQLGIGVYPGFPIAADIAGVVLCPAQDATTRADIRRYLGAKVGLSL
jgi:hypothetical protein